MSTIKKQSNGKVKAKKKMSKAEMQLAIIKKKQCDAKALVIVEQLLEPNVNSDWLLQNLKFINKTQMEDVIEERAIIKLCGYVLCSKPLTVVVKQQYRISTRTNKVYDISRRKNFCSSLCYGATDYLLEQMLESPLWLREKEDIPIFKILSTNSVHPLPGDEIDVGVNFSQDANTDNIDMNKQHTGCNETEETRDYLLTTTSSADVDNSNTPSSSNSNTNIECTQTEIPLNMSTQHLNEARSTELRTYQEDKQCDLQEQRAKSENPETHKHVQFDNILHLQKHGDINIENESVGLKVICSNNDTEILESELDKISNNENNGREASQLAEVNNSHNIKDGKKVQFQLDRVCRKENTAISLKPSDEARKNKHKKIKNKNKHEQEEFSDTEIQASVYHNLIMHVEQSFREWITKNTLCLLLGEEDEKSQLLENLTQQDRYEQLCKKLNRLQLQNEKEDHVNLEKQVLKPLPQLSELQEEGKKLELKVRAFYEGQMVITEDDKSKNGDENREEEPVLPLTDAYAPRALRRRIFLDNLSKVLPDLLCALTRMPANTSTSFVTQRIFDKDTYSLIKLMISTFNLSATNIVFKTAEWTLVGLIIIKMLSLIDIQFQSLLGSKEALMYTSMILMSYKLDSGYLDRLITDVINSKNACESCNKQNLLE